MPPLHELILQLVDVFDRLGISYAFGGAVATSYWGTVRTTEDADCLVSVPAVAYQQLADELNAMGCVVDVPASGSPVTVAALRAQVEQRNYMAVEWKSIRADLFVPIIPLQNEILRRAVLKPMEDRQISVTTAEDLILLKMAFHRVKDIMDVGGILYLQEGNLDLEYIRHWSEQIHDEVTKNELNAMIESYADDEDGQQ